MPHHYRLKMVEPAGNISSVLGVVLQVGKWVAAPLWRQFKYLYNYNTNFDNLQEEVNRLKDAKDRVERKVDAAERNVEEIEGNVKKWQNNVEKTVVQAERLIQDKSNNPRCLKGLCPNLKTCYKHSKKAFKLKRDDIGPLLQQEERFEGVSYPSIQQSNYEKNFDKLRDDVLKMKNARLKVQHKVEEAKINGEETEEDVKKWLEDVDSIIVKAEEMIENQSSIGTDRKTRYQNSKAASELMVEDIGPLLQQEERFHKVSYSSIQQSDYEKNFDKLGYDVFKLMNARRKVQRKVEEAKNNVEEIEEDVKKWLEDVDSIIVKAEELIENQSSVSTDWESRYRNSKAASKLMVDNIGPLLQQGERFDKVSHPTIHKEIWLRYNEDYLAFKSRNSTVKNVLDALNDEEILMMGVYGMGGLGKTTLVQEIGRKAEKDKLFDEIVFVEVTETLDVKRIQTEIADKLGVKFNNESERTSKLYERLRNDKKILLILDNVWEDLDLRTVGIPLGVNHDGCKLLLTTRNLDVLDKMGSKSNFGMNVLNEEEAWNLFQKMAGNVIQTRELNSLPNDVCKECGGLPIVIATVARALRNKRNQFEWEDALRELRAPSPTKFIGYLEKEYQKIALSYKYLRDELKKTFPISSLMKNSTSISDLFKHIVSLDILKGDNLTMEQARKRLDKVVRELKYSCLLLHGFTDRQFSMHDVIRAFAITIAFTDHHVFTERNDIERVWKDKNKLRKCTGISLPGSSISQFWRKDWDCPDLEFFYSTWGYTFEIPEEFFTVMPKLKVLNLFNMQQSSLPSSLDLLTNLQTLCLDGSHIESVAIIGKLENLKVLSLQQLAIEELPIEIGQLTQLKLFKLSHCQSLKIIAPNVISKLLQLEEFYVRGCPSQWKVEVLEELKLLSQLACLDINIVDSKMLPKDFFSKELKS
ncbi:probable disease resistance protein At4g27220 [Pistacia vera]|uniref:probable disease resistance protein At4g27220 n=1 Tax=Pistacia vera TaxID=55513 RepID=UPI0012630FD5|nr:probable disease resistance protein At4g27220 [Pistacia vera]